MKVKSFKIFFILLLAIPLNFFCQEDGAFEIVRLKYSGGGDWYNDPSAEVNLLKFLEEETNIETNPEYKFVELSSDEIFSHPFLFMTGHGNVVFSDDEADRLRTYLMNGGFLFIDDDYGMDKAVRREIKKVFPEKDFFELPFSHSIYSILFDFNNGPPKTHKHDENAPHGFGIMIDERVAVFYTVESNPSDGWADPDVHNDPEIKREEALKFGANIVLYALTNK